MMRAGCWRETPVTQGRETRRKRRWRWPLWGVLLVLLMLGHDALMASQALAAPHQDRVMAHHAPTSPAGEHARPGPHDPAPLAPHPEQCSVGIVALVRNPDDASGSGAADLVLPAALVTAICLPASPGDRAATWVEPHWPPGTQRALWQVYRL